MPHSSFGIFLDITQVTTQLSKLHMKILRKASLGLKDFLRPYASVLAPICQRHQMVDRCGRVSGIRTTNRAKNESAGGLGNDPEDNYKKRPAWRN